MRRDHARLRAQAVAGAGAAALLLVFAGGAGGLVWLALAPAERTQLAALLAPRLPVVVVIALALSAAVAGLASGWLRRWVGAPSRLLEDAQVLLRTDTRRSLSAVDGAPAVQGLARLISDLAADRDRLRDDVARQVAEASRGVMQERNRLAALMSELTQSVVVCNLEGQVLLYNNRARMQFRALSDAPQMAGGAELIGLGRSIYGVFDPKLVAHALDRVRQRLQRGVAHPSAQFVTVTRSGQLLRVQLAPVRVAEADGGAAAGGAGADAPEAVPLSGFVLMLDNVTREYEQEAAREHLLHTLTEGQRGALSNLQMAIELLDDPALPGPARERFMGVAREAVRAMGQQLAEVVARAGEREQATRWPLEDMLGADFLQAAQQRIASATGLRTGLLEVDEALWLKVDSFALLQALGFLAQRLHEAFELNALHLRLGRHDAQRATLDLVWTGQAMSTETVMSWEMDPMASGGEHSALTVRDVVQRHGGAVWFERDRLRHWAFFRFLLPQAQAATGQAPSAGPASAAGTGAPALATTDARPEFYDFDLFATTASSYALDEGRLADLVYTVFDTETTGLQPGEGDEIIQLGAVRVLKGKLLRGECIDQLVDPGRSIPAAGIPIHGITPEMVRGQPRIAQVLPAFHAFARDTVLVAHNAAFDMRFLQLKEAASGLRFDHPVLDTLLLSAVVHPQQESHRLEAIAERFGIPVVARHTALGDALVTAEVFLRLVPLLAAMGIHTLGQAREAAQTTYYARLRY